MRKVLLVVHTLVLYVLSTVTYAQEKVNILQQEAQLGALLDQAIYGQEHYQTRITHFKKILSLMHQGVSEHFIRSYVKALQGLFIARAHTDVNHLMLLRDLFLSAEKEVILQDVKVQLEEWVNEINKNLAEFALHDGDIIRIRNDKLNEYLYALAKKRVQYGVSSLFLTSEKKTDVQIGASLFRIKKNSGIGKVVHYGDNVTFEPLYVQINNFIYTSAPNSSIALISSLRRGKNYNGVGIVWGGASSQIEDHCFRLKKTSDVRNDEKFYKNTFPVLTGEGLMIIHEHTGRAFSGVTVAVDLYKKARLSMKKIEHSTHLYRTGAPKPFLLQGAMVFSFDRVSTEELQNIYCVQFDYLLKRAKEHTDLGDRIASYEVTIQLLSHDVGQDKQDALSHDLQQLFYQRVADVKILKQMRSLFIQAASHAVFEPRRIEFENYVGHINKDLVPLGMQYGDIVQIRSNCQNKRLLWTHGDSRYQSGGHLEVVAGPNEHKNTKSGPQLFRIHSAEGKSGPVQYGDPIELIAMYAGSGTIHGSLGQGQKLWVNPSSYCGKQFFEVLVGPNSCNQAQNGQEVFFLRPHRDFAKAVTTRINPVLADDKIEIWSRQFNRKIWINTSSLSVENSHEILVGPNDDNYLGVNRTENGQQLFLLERMNKDQLMAIADADFYSRLTTIKQANGFEQRVNAIQDFFAYVSHNEFVSEDAKESFVEELQDLFSRRQGIEETLLARFAGFITASVSSANFFTAKQRELLYSCADVLAIEKTERAIDVGFIRASEHHDYIMLVSTYKEIVPLMDSKYARRKSAEFIGKLYDLSQHVKNMKSQELAALKGLLSEALRLDYGVDQQQDDVVKKLAHLYEMNKELSFKAQLAEASQTHGVKQIEAYKALLPHAHKMTETQRVELIRSLKGIFESKVNEIKEIKDVLEKANSHASNFF